MNAQRLLDTFLDLVRIDSISRKEGRVAAYCQQILEQTGCSVSYDSSAAQTGSEVGNLIACLPGSLPAKVYFSAHMDTVNPGENIEPIIKDGVIYSAGDTILGGDDKVGIAAIIELVRTFSEEKQPHPEIGILLTTCEEISLLGAHALSSEDFAGEACFVLDAGGDPGTIIIGAPWHYWFTATFTGQASHAGIEPEKGTSAITLAAKAINAMELGRLDEHTTANLGTIHGGNANNIVADTCVLTGEFRSLDQQRIAEVQDQIRSALEAAVAGTKGSVEIVWTEQYPGFDIPHHDPLVQLALDTAAGIGLNALAVYTGGGSDANILAKKGLRPLVLGTGMTNVHGFTEQLAIRDLEDLTKLSIALVDALSLRAN